MMFIAKCLVSNIFVRAKQERITYYINNHAHYILFKSCFIMKEHNFTDINIIIIF